MTEKEYFKDIKKQHIEKALERILEEGYDAKRKSSTYDLVYNGYAFPPKYVASLASYFASEYYLPHSKFNGGEDSTCFELLREKGFEILPKSETKDLNEPKISSNVHLKYINLKIEEELNQVKFKEHFEAYISYCKRSQWLKYREAYKFRFARWLNERIDFDTQSDEEILKLCIESQEQEYDDGTKGINFIVSSLRFQDDFIAIVDIQNLRKIREGKLLEDQDLKDSPLSYPKFSVWAATLIPDRFKVYGRDDLLKPISYLFDLENKSSAGVRGFNLAMTCLNEMAEKAKEKFESELLALIRLVYPSTNRLTDLDLVWLLQDFTLYMNTRVLEYEPQHYWVNQGDNYKVELEHGIVAAPNDNLHHHKCLKDLYEGDVIIHYANSAIRAVSKVTKEFELRARPYGANGNNDLLVEVDYEEVKTPISIDSIKETFRGNEELLPKKYGPFTKDLGIAQKYMCEFNRDAYNLLFHGYDTEFDKTNDNIFNDPKNANETTAMNPLNQILYGPPGTGKTFITKNKALALIGVDVKTLSREAINKEFEKYCKERRIVFTTFHQSMSYEDFIEGIKPETNDEGQVEYDVQPGIFIEIAESCRASSDGQFEEVYDQLIKDLTDTPEEYLELKTPRGRVFRVKANSNQNLSLYTSKEIKYQGVLSKNKLKKEFFTGGAYKGWEGYASAILEHLMSKYHLTKSTNYGDSKLPYILIIDEINRGNVSQIFGELITLIEEDKREGKQEEISVTLPYSKEEFTVPENLYIIGTMNTADRSVEALDTALRRRFSFKEMMPKPELLSESREEGVGEVDGIRLENLLRTMNERIEVLVDRDHTIGHSYFLKVKNKQDLKNVFKDKVIPLLQEYFFGDYSKMEMVIGPEFFEKDLKEVKFAVPAEDYMETGKRFVLKDLDHDDFDIIPALKRMLNIKEEVPAE